MIGRISVEQRIVDSARKRAAILGCSVLVGLLLGSAIIIASGSNVLEVYAETVDAIVGSARSVQQTLRATTPLILTGLAAAVAFRMRLYTIGAEGQLYIGAITGSGMALLLGDGHPAIYVVPAVLLAGVIGGVVWALIIAVPRAYFGTDEVVGTLMLNFIALHIMNWLIFGSVSFWRDRENLGFPGGKDRAGSGSVAPVLGTGRHRHLHRSRAGADPGAVPEVDIPRVRVERDRRLPARRHLLRDERPPPDHLGAGPLGGAGGHGGGDAGRFRHLRAGAARPRIGQSRVHRHRGSRHRRPQSQSHRAGRVRGGRHHDRRAVAEPHRSLTRQRHRARGHPAAERRRRAVLQPLHPSRWRPPRQEAPAEPAS